MATERHRPRARTQGSERTDPIHRGHEIMLQTVAVAGDALQLRGWVEGSQHHAIKIVTGDP